MKFSATSFWNAVAKGAAKVVIERVYVRKVTDLSLALNSGAWMEITDRLESMPTINLRIEYEVGQYTADAVSFTGIGITWFKNNVFNATASEYIEIKAECKIGLSETRLATDLAYMYCGFVDKQVRYSEINDTVSFTALTADDLLAGFAVENISTQYIDPDIDGAGTDGLILFDIPGVWVKNANVTSFVLRAGVHTITYEYNSGGGNQRAKLDDGDWVTIGGSSGVKTLSNKDVNQKVEIYVITSFLPTSTEAITEKIVVTNPGTTLPKHFYRSTNIKRIITKICEKVGITSLTFDAMEFDSHDGTGRLTFIETPPNDETQIGYKRALANDGTDLWVGVGNLLYKRTMATETYALKATADAGYNIIKLLYNARNNHLWMVLQSGSNFRLRYYDIAGDTLSSSITLNSPGTMHSIALIDYEYSPGSWKYGICYIDDSLDRFRFVDDSMTDSLIASVANASSGFAYIRGGNTYWFQKLVPGTPNTYFTHGYQVDGSGNWVDQGISSAGQPDGIHQVAAYIESEDRVYYWDSTALKVRAHLRTGTTSTDLLTLSSGDAVECMHFGNSRVYFTTKTAGKLYSAVSNAATLLQDAEPAHAQYSQLNYLTDRLYGIDVNGVLFQYHTVIRMFIRDAVGEGSAKDLLNKVHQAYMLLYTFSPIKAAYVYRRGNSAGIPQTSGNTISITVNESEILEEETQKYEAIQLVRVSNGRVTTSYDGTTFDAEVLSDKRTLEITNDFIPDSIIKDVAYFVYQFFKTNRTLYKFSLPVMPLFQYEVFDNANVTFTTTKIQKTGSGPIYAARYEPDGTLGLEVLI